MSKQPGGAGTMSNIEQYRKLEDRIKRGDVDALIARWQFGRKLLAEQDGDLRIGELSNAIRISEPELYNRRQFAREFATEAKVREAYASYHSWYQICKSGLGRRAEAERLHGHGLPPDWTMGKDGLVHPPGWDDALAAQEWLRKRL